MLKEKLLEDLKESMKEKNTIRKNVVQMVRAAILQVEKDKHIEVSDDKIVEIIAKEAKKRKDSLEDFQKSGREDLIEQINKEIEILNEYLPKQLTQEELKEVDISVDLLHEPEKTTFEELNPKEYGVIVSSGSKRGLLLPKLEGIDTSEQQVAIAMEKGNIRPSDNYVLERFKVERFKECEDDE